jgi:aminoglycoside phosphotransferase (APT) family kinase protein
MDTWWPIVPAEDDVALQEAAAAAGVLLPAPVRSRSGAVVESIGEHSWRVNEWAHSGPPLAAPAGATVTREVGGILATLHGLALPVDRISPWHRGRLSPVSWSRLAALAGGASWAAELAEAVPVLEELATIDDDPTAPVLTHNTLGPGQVRRGRGQLVVCAWEHAGGQPPSWELGGALVDWAIDLSTMRVNAVGARALVEGYRATAGALPALGMGMFRGAVTGLANYVFGQVEHALGAGGEDRRHADRRVRRVLTPAALARLLDVVAAVR